MKALILSLLFPFFIYSQDKKHFEAELIESHYFDSNKNLISSTGLGKNITIDLDTFFKIWIIRYSDFNGIKQSIKLTYIQKDKYGSFIVMDPYNNMFLMDSNIDEDNNLLICSEEKLDNGNTYCIQIKGIYRIRE